jgi:hypothetical protein
VGRLMPRDESAVVQSGGDCLLGGGQVDRALVDGGVQMCFDGELVLIAVSDDTRLESGSRCP